RHRQTDPARTGGAAEVVTPVADARPAGWPAQALADA
ncbi:MAG: hypothetical protein JWQ97_84, partial [Phenylobacterium sp.]|nr:hypothetical protein [Phenylobacterium sp.]